jgi:membrane-associated phospholipid phosphatase
MEAIHTLEIAVNIYLQSLGPTLQALMRAITLFGDELFFIIFMPALYWCVDALVGLRIGIMLLLSTALNSFFKLLWKGPRPYWISDQVTPLVRESSFGIPSGHAMTATSVWGWAAMEVKKKTFTIFCIVLILLIGISRLVVGAHFLTDVLAGFLLGGLLLAAFARWVGPLSTWFAGLHLSGQILASLASALVLVGLNGLVVALTGSWALPPDWAARAGQVSPLSLSGALTAGGTWFGMLAGFSILRARQGTLQSAQGTWQKIARYLLGIAGVLLLYLGLGQVFSTINAQAAVPLLEYLLRFVRYSLIGLWISWLAPLLFRRIGLAAIQPIDTAQG